MKYSYTKNPESGFYKESKFNKKKNSCGREGRGGVARVMFCFFFFQKNPSLKKKLFYF